MLSGKTNPSNYVSRSRVKMDPGSVQDDEGGFPWFSVAKWIVKNIAVPVARKYVVPWAKKKLGFGGGILLPGQRLGGGRAPSDLPLLSYDPSTGAYFRGPKSFTGGAADIDKEELKRYATQYGNDVLDIAERATDVKDFVKQVIDKVGRKNM